MAVFTEVKLSGWSAAGDARTIWEKVTVPAGTDSIVVSSKTPVILLGVAWDSAHDATKATVQLDPTESSDYTAGTWLPVSIDGSPAELSVGVGTITAFSYSTAFPFERVVLALDVAETADRTIYLLLWRAD